jgi:hypothetical protein
MKVFYDEGMPMMNFSAAGDFRKGEPKEVPDDLAKELLRKGRVKIWEEKEEENSRKGAKTPRKQE